MLSSLLFITAFSQLSATEYLTKSEKIYKYAVAFVLSYGICLSFSIIMLIINQQDNIHLSSLAVAAFLVYLAVNYRKLVTSRILISNTVKTLRHIGGDLLFPCSTSINIGTSLAKKMTILFVISSLVVSFFSSVTNGDSQAYNISRLYVLILSKSTFLQSTSTPVQAFHSFAHDYLYLPDIIINNIKGLGLISSFEAIITLILLDQYIISYSHCNSVGINSARAICRLACISMQPFFYQATITKNDLVIAPLTISTLVICYKLFSDLKALGQFKLGSLLNGRSTIPFDLIVATLSLLLIYESKGFGILYVFAISLSLALSAPFISSIYTKHNTCTLRIPIKTAIMATSLVALYAIFFHIQANIYWSAEYTSFRLRHGPNSVYSLFSSMPLTLSRHLIESLFNLPTPFQFPTTLLPYVSTDKYIALADQYQFGGVINEDIAWPGIVFNIVLFVLGLKILRQILSRNLVATHFLRISLPFTVLASVSLICVVGLCSFLYWQPFSSRFFLSPALLSLPTLSILVTRRHAPS